MMVTWMISELLTALIKGFVLCASEVIAFAPQNLFILEQGLRVWRHKG